MKLCRTCKKVFRPRPVQLQKGDYICRDCQKIYNFHYHAKRWAAGLDRKRGAWDPIKKARWLKNYSARPDVRRRRALAMKRYSRDPRLRMRHEARWQAREAVKRGKIKRSSCAHCAEPKAQIHHPDYYKPLEIIWLCVNCHRREHMRLKGGSDG